MSWPFTSRAANLSVESIMSEARSRRTGTSKKVDRDQALRTSSVWACLRLRADLVSTMPLDVFRRVEGMQVELPKPPIFVTPGGEKVGIEEHLYSSQFDLDSNGNTVGLITEIDGNGKPRRIDLVPIGSVVVRTKKGVVEYLIDGKKVPTENVWHEKQFTTSGIPVGLSPIAYAALTLNPALSAQEFAASWFGNGVTPSAHLKNTSKTLKGTQADAVKSRFLANVRDGEPFVTGNDWEYHLLSAKASESMYLEHLKATPADVCRYLGVPGDMIDADSSTGNVTYANVTQRNLQLLIMNLNPALVRREKAMSRGLLPGGRFVEFNRGALLQMDLKTRYEAHGIAIEKRFLAPSEVRALENRAPFTDEQLAEFAALFPQKAATPTNAPAGGQQA